MTNDVMTPRTPSPIVFKQKVKTAKVLRVKAPLRFGIKHQGTSQSVSHKEMSQSLKYPSSQTSQSSNTDKVASKSEKRLSTKSKDLDASFSTTGGNLSISQSLSILSKLFNV